MRRTAYSSYHSLSIEEVKAEEKRKENPIRRLFGYYIADASSNEHTDSKVDLSLSLSNSILHESIEEKCQEDAAFPQVAKQNDPDIAVELPQPRQENETQKPGNNELHSTAELRIRSTLSQKGTKRLQQLDMLKPGLYDERSDQDEEHEQ